MFSHVPYLIEHHPRTAAITFVIAIVFAIFMMRGLEFDVERRIAEREAYWKAKLECRQSGGSHESFGTEGWVCIKPKQ